MCNLFSSRLPFILASVFVAGLLLLTLSNLIDARVTTLPVSSGTIYRYIALMGDEATIASVTAPAISAGDLRFLRRYVNPTTFLDEASTDYYPGGYPPNLVLELYEATTMPSEATDVILTLADSAIISGLQAEYEDLTWLSYVPNQVIVSGDYEDLGILASAFITDLIPTGSVRLDFCSLCPPTDTEQIWLFGISSIKRVVTLVQELNDYAAQTPLSVTAEPNYLIVGAQQHIAGSPGGPSEPGAVPLYHSSELTTTGFNVGVVIFDTIPEGALPYDPIYIEGELVTVLESVSFASDLPVGDVIMPAHGTFVATPITQLAPGAVTYLLGVLNEYTYGDSFSFFETAEENAIYYLYSQFFRTGLVFNYSFVQESPSPQASGQSTSMEAFLTAVDNQNIVQVAAAGNDSAFTLTPQEMRLPARHDDVWGVTAVTPGGSHACYANKGDIAARGGGIPRETDNCNIRQIVVERCATPGGLMGLETCVSGWDTDSGTSWSWGVGTSFAAPVAAGLAAQAIELLRPPPSPLSNDGRLASEEFIGLPPDPAEVWAYLLSLATPAGDPALGAGILPGPSKPTNIYLPIIQKP